MSFTSCDRIKAVIRHQPVDRVPRGELCFDDGVVSQALGCDRVGFEERLTFVRWLGLDLISLSPRYPASGDIPAAAEVGWPDLARWTAATPLFTFAVVDAAFGWGFRLLGFERFLTLPTRSPQTLVDLVTGVERLNLGLFSRLADQGVDGIILADDIAYNQGLLINPRFLRQYFFPSLATQVEVIRRLGMSAFFHSDGNTGGVLMDIIEAGFQGLHCIDPNAGMDIGKLQAEYGERLCFWGTLDAGRLTGDVGPASLEELVRSLQASASRGSFILGTTSGLFPGLDLNLLRQVYGALELPRG